MRVARSRELVAAGYGVAAVARVLQVTRQAIYRVPKPRRRPQQRPVFDAVEMAIVEVVKDNSTDATGGLGADASAAGAGGQPQAGAAVSEGHKTGTSSRRNRPETLRSRAQRAGDLDAWHQEVVGSSPTSSNQERPAHAGFFCCRASAISARAARNSLASVRQCPISTLQQRAQPLGFCVAAVHLPRVDRDGTFGVRCPIWAMTYGGASPTANRAPSEGD